MQDFMGWGNQADEEELSEEELAQELEAYLQALESGGLPNIGRDMQEGSWREGSPPPSSIRRLNRKNGDVGAIQDLASREMPNIGRAMQEGSWQGSPAPQQPMQQPGVPSPFDQHIPPDDAFNQMNDAPGVTPRPPTAPPSNGWDNWTAGTAVDAAPQVNAQGAWPQPQSPMADDPALQVPNDPSPPMETVAAQAPPSELDNAYANTIYAGMSPEDRALMQLQPSETRNSLRRTFEGFGVPVEFQGVSDGSTMPVVPAAMMDRMGQANASQTPNMRGAVFDDEMVDGVPTFTNESIRRREQLGWLPKAADEQARIERNAQEAFEATPEYRAFAAQQAADIEKEDRQFERELERDGIKHNQALEIAGMGAQPAGRPVLGRSLRGAATGGTTGGSRSSGQGDAIPAGVEGRLAAMYPRGFNNSFFNRRFGTNDPAELSTLINNDFAQFTDRIPENVPAGHYVNNNPAAAFDLYALSLGMEQGENKGGSSLTRSTWDWLFPTPNKGRSISPDEILQGVTTLVSSTNPDELLGGKTLTINGKKVNTGEFTTDQRQILHRVAQQVQDALIMNPSELGQKAREDFAKRQHEAAVAELRGQSRSHSLRRILQGEQEVLSAEPRRRQEELDSQLQQIQNMTPLEYLEFMRRNRIQSDINARVRNGET